jgi:hypothetical protein
MSEGEEEELGGTSADESDGPAARTVEGRNSGREKTSAKASQEGITAYSVQRQQCLEWAFPIKKIRMDLVEVRPDIIVLPRSLYHFPSPLTLTHMHVHTLLGLGPSNCREPEKEEYEARGAGR